MDVQVIHNASGVMEIVLDRPKALNALTPFMISAIDEALNVAESDATVTIIVIRSSIEKAFCAGGDVKGFHECGIENAHIAQVFAEREYELVRRIYHFEKPIVTIASGIVMGGGAGLALPARYVIGTETTKFAMPEVSIGYFPDVGSTYYLSRLPKKVGWFLAMTGSMIGAADLQACGLIKHFIPSTKITEFIENLPQSVLKMPIDLGKPVLDFDKIEKSFSLKSVDEIIDSFGKEWFSNKSPSSIQIAFEELKVAQKMGFDQVIDLDVNIAKEVLKMPDVYEGVRAKLIDKDNLPKWQQTGGLERLLVSIQKGFL